jgi:hypothetical protein
MKNIFNILMLLLFSDFLFANNAPTFTRGGNVNWTVCKDNPATDINSLLQASDADNGQTLTWAVVTNPSHGSLLGFSSATATSNGGIVLPSGLTYTPFLSYTGSDLFKISVFDGTSTASITVHVSVKQMPSAISIISNGGTGVCDPSTVLYKIDPTMASITGFALQWNNGGTPITGATNATYTASGVGSGTISLTVSDGSNCTNTSANLSYLIKPIPATPIISPQGPTTFCVGNAVALNGNPVNTVGQAYKWYKGTNTYIQDGYTILAKASGSYKVVEWVNGCSSTSAPITITVNPLPIATLTATSPTTFCQGNTCTFNASPTGVGYSYNWMNIPNLTTTTNTPTFAFGISGTVRVQVTNNNGCISKISAGKVIKANPLPFPLFTSIPQGSGYKLNASPPVGCTYQWYLGGNPIPNAINKTYTTSSSGSYSVMVTVTATGCSAMSPSVSLKPAPANEQSTVEYSDNNLSLSAYPNPVNDLLTFFIAGVEEINATLQLIDMNGKLFLSKTITEPTISIDMKDYASGLYFLRYKDAEGRAGTVKVVKE